MQPPKKPSAGPGSLPLPSTPPVGTHSRWTPGCRTGMLPHWSANPAKTGATATCALPSITFRMSSAPVFPRSPPARYRTPAPSSPVPQRSSTAPIASPVSAASPTSNGLAASPTDPRYRLPIFCDCRVPRHSILSAIEQHRQRPHQLHNHAHLSSGEERPRDGGYFRAAAEDECRRAGAA